MLIPRPPRNTTHRRVAKSYSKSVEWNWFSRPIKTTWGGEETSRGGGRERGREKKGVGGGERGKEKRGEEEREREQEKYE